MIDKSEVSQIVINSRPVATRYIKSEDTAGAPAQLTVRCLY